MGSSDRPIVDVALGFQTQSRFTTAFKRYVSQTPQALVPLLAARPARPWPVHDPTAVLAN